MSKTAAKPAARSAARSAASEDRSASPRPTLASLAAEIAALRSRVEGLEQQLAAAGPPPVAAPEPEPAPVAEPARAVLARTTDPVADIRAVLRRMFELALAADPYDEETMQAGFEEFKLLVHHDRRGSPLLDQDLLQYKWRPLCNRVRAYLAIPDDPGSFEITQMAPHQLEPRTDSARVFLRADRRMPPPVSLRRDPLAGGAFRIDTSSL